MCTTSVHKQGGIRATAAAGLAPDRIRARGWRVAAQGTKTLLPPDSLATMVWHDRGAPMKTDHFDVVVVGAGAAGCVLANRLTEEPHRSVLLIEAGPDHGPDPSTWPNSLRDPSDVPADSHPWGYADADRPADRPLPLPRARVIGGSTTINACTWLRGSAADYYVWAAQGNEGWSFEDLLP